MEGILVRGKLRPKPGREAALREWIGEIVERVRADEPGTVMFAFSQDARSGDIVATEYYADSRAALSHLANVAPLLERLPALVEDAGSPLEVAGEIVPELRAIFDGYGAVYRPLLAAR